MINKCFFTSQPVDPNKLCLTDLMLEPLPLLCCINVCSAKSWAWGVCSSLDLSYSCWGRICPLTNITMISVRCFEVPHGWHLTNKKPRKSAQHYSPQPCSRNADDPRKVFCIFFSLCIYESASYITILGRSGYDALCRVHSSLVFFFYRCCMPQWVFNIQI